MSGLDLNPRSGLVFLSTSVSLRLDLGIRVSASYVGLENPRSGLVFLSISVSVMLGLGIRCAFPVGPVSGVAPSRARCVSLVAGGATLKGCPRMSWAAVKGCP